MVLAHTQWIMEPTKRGLAVSGTDAHSLMASSRVRAARRQQLLAKPCASSASLDAQPMRARELCITPTLIGRIPAMVSPATASSIDYLHSLGRHALPRPHTAGGSNLSHGVRAQPISAMQPHVHTHEFRTQADRDTVVRRVGTPTTDRARADMLTNGHRLGFKRRGGHALAQPSSAGIGRTPQLIDLAYRSVAPTGVHWRLENRPATAPGKTYVLLHEAGMQRVVLEDLSPSMWGASAKELAKRATVYQAAEPGIIIFKREWNATFGRSGR
jgi:hypothetical protein